MRRLLLALVAVLLGAAPAWAAVAFDAVGTAQSGTGTSANIPITLGSGHNTAVVVGFGGGTNTTGITCTMNAGAETLTVISGTDGGGTTGTVQLGKVTYLTGAQTVACSWTTSQSYGINAISFTGVNRATPFNNGTFTSGATPLGISVTSTSGDMTTTVVEEGTGNNVTTNQTSKWSVDPAGSTRRAGDIGPGSGSTTHTWTASSGSIFGSGANIVQSPASGVFMLDGTAANAPISTNTGDLSFTLAPGAQLWIMVVAVGGATPPVITGVTYNGVDVPNERSTTDGALTSMNTYQSFQTPLTGDGAAHDVLVSFDQVVTEAIVAAASFFGASTTTTTAANVSGTSTAPSSGSLSPAAGTLVVDAVGIGNGGSAGQTPTQNGAQTLIASGDIGSFKLGYGISMRAGGSTFSMDWTIGSSDRWTSQSLILNPPSTAGIFRTQGDLTGVGTGGKFHKDPLQ